MRKVEKFFVEVEMPEGEFLSEGFVQRLVESDFYYELQEGRWKVKVTKIN